MRMHNEDSYFDSRLDVGAGAYNSPYRAAPLFWENDGHKLFGSDKQHTFYNNKIFIGRNTTLFHNML